MHCSMSDDYVKIAASSSGLDQLESDVLHDIEGSFNITPRYGIQTDDLSSLRYQIESLNPQLLFLRDPRTKGGRFLNAPQRIFLVNNLEWVANLHLTMHPRNRGTVNYAIGAILLHENGDKGNSWCIKTLVHETLHSVSMYSRVWNRFPNMMRLQRFFREGITECLAGYALLKCKPDCYQGWKSGKFKRCSISYKNHVRLWCSFCQCVGIRDLAKFYLSTEENPVEAWNQLVQSVQNAGFQNFNYRLDPNRAFNEQQLRQTCINAFPEFQEIYESLTRSLDFSRIP